MSNPSADPTVGSTGNPRSGEASPVSPELELSGADPALAQFGGRAGKSLIPAAGRGNAGGSLHLCSPQGSKAAGGGPAAQGDSRSHQDVPEAGAAQIPAGRFGSCSTAVFTRFG